jgi:hypothetical protein
MPTNERKAVHIKVGLRLRVKGWLSVVLGLQMLTNERRAVRVRSLGLRVQG